MLQYFQLLLLAYIFPPFYKIPKDVSSFVILSMAIDINFDSVTLQTIFPESKRNITVFGSSGLYITPGKILGLYSTFDKELAIARKSRFLLISIDATMFFICISGSLYVFKSR